MADVAVESELERRAGETDLEAGSVALQRGNEVWETARGGGWLVKPREGAGGGKASGDRRPGECHFHVRERLDDFVRLIAQDDGAVRDSDLRKRRRPIRAGFEISRQCLDVTRPVRAVVGVEDDRDG